MDKPAASARLHVTALGVYKARLNGRRVGDAYLSPGWPLAAAFYAKVRDDVADAQHPSGAYPDIAPRLSIPWAGAPAWADAGVIVPWTV